MLSMTAILNHVQVINEIFCQQALTERQKKNITYKYIHLPEADDNSKTEVTVMVRCAQMFSFASATIFFFYISGFAALTRHVTIQMKGNRCQSALQIEDRLHIAEQTSLGLNFQACQAHQPSGRSLSLSVFKT